MKVDKAIVLSVLATSISGAAIRDLEFKRDLIGEVAGSTEQDQVQKRGFLSSLIGSVTSWLDSNSSSGDSAGVDTTPVATTAAPAPAAPAATVPSLGDTDLAEPTQSVIPTSTEEDDGWFPHFTWPNFKTGTTVSSSAAASSTAPPVFTSSTSAPYSTASSSGPVESSGGLGGGSEVERYSEQAGGIAYSPYSKGGQCKSQQEVGHDMKVLSSYKIIRLYGVDCNCVDNTLATINSDQKLFVGIYNIDSYNINQDLTILKKAVEGSSRGWSAIDTVSIGNELVNAGQANAQQIVTAVKTAKSWFKQNAPDYTGPVVSVDTLVAVLHNPALCDASDYLAVNSHPFWDGSVQPQNSGSFLQSQISLLKSTCGSNKRILIAESGWPVKGDSFGSCVPSVQNQLTAVKSIINALGEDVLMFTTYNDYWKDGGQYGVEKYWGIYGDPQD